MARVTIEKLVYGGQALARNENKVIFVWGALPGEEVEVEITNQKKNFAEGVVTKIYKASPDRLEPIEGHYASCSPWQIMKPKTEDYWKKEMTLEMYRKLGFLPEDLEIDLISDQNKFEHYRNKIEYNFCLNADNEISYAFFERNTNDLIAISDCCLASKAIGIASAKVLTWLRQSGLSIEILAKIIFRSNEVGEVMADLFINQKKELISTPAWDENLVSFQIYLTEDRGGERIFSQGKKTLVENFNDFTFRFDGLSFFQVNWPIFTKVLEDIQAVVDDESLVVDYYSGVGAIGLSLAHRVQKVTLVESDDNAINLARQNIQDNKITNCNILKGDSSELLDSITKSRTVIFDPPRAGLDARVIDRILYQKPKQIIYLSCDPATQARDCAKLKNDYIVKMIRLYNFFPRTPHVEALWVLERK
ncbi:MAG: hypothetical protein UT32_C0003G0033 [Parcubacteria group bacterium GW2011_GWC2_39_14]|nr:MAG: hypothetical protein UT32_C0003G0033 [Parcubacteria group bacterium GW2011_GWC2_39_14]KKR54982.1 MAG: hypothetical protein UT91_C0006G0033 [Parcubacteria group bacterium GW2011_GWA2_40_23]